MSDETPLGVVGGILLWGFTTIGAVVVHYGILNDIVGNAIVGTAVLVITLGLTIWSVAVNADDY